MGAVNNILSDLEKSFPGAVTRVEGQGLSVFLRAEQVWSFRVLEHLKSRGFEHLSDVTGVDYIHDSEFEVIYHLWSHSLKARIGVMVRIPRDEPVIRSVASLWSGAQIHERETHEMFGIVFEGNPDLSPLFLEDWKEIPPFRKDFDSREYVKKELEEVD